MSRTLHNNKIGLYFGIFILFLLSMNVWIGWEGRYSYINLCVSLLLVVIIIKDNVGLDFSLNKLLPLMCIIMGNLYICVVDDTFRIGLFFTLYLPYAIIILLKQKDQVLCLRYIVKWFAILMIPCLATYILVQTVGIPSVGKVWVNHLAIHDTSYILRDNYLFYVYSSFYGIRFNGPFIEPGHLGMMSAFLLFADGFQFSKKETWIILITLLFTFSLAGYVLAFIGYIFNLYVGKKVSLKNLTITIIAILLAYFYSEYYNGGDNVLNNEIFSRLETDTERGFKGNNRVKEQILLYYASMYNDNELLLYGYGKSTVDWLSAQHAQGTGIYMCMVHYGLIGSMMAMLFYFIYAIMRKTKIAFLSFVFVLFLFWQRSYSFWFSWVICFVYGISNYQYNKDITIKKNEL